jgi:hypothetical protein
MFYISLLSILSTSSATKYTLDAPECPIIITSDISKTPYQAILLDKYEIIRENYVCFEVTLRVRDKMD